MGLRGVIVQPLETGRGQLGQQQLQHHILGAARSLAGGAHLHARLHGAAATGRQRALAVHLDHAGAAVAVGAQAVREAQARDLHAVALGGLQDGFALEGGGGLAVEFESNASECRRHASTSCAK